MTLRFDPPWKGTEGVLATGAETEKDNGNRLQDVL